MTSEYKCLNLRVTSGFRREMDENCALLGCYIANSGNSLPTFRNNFSAPSLRPFLKMGPAFLKVGTIGCPETSLKNYHYFLPNSPDESSSHIWTKAVHTPFIRTLPFINNYLPRVTWCVWVERGRDKGVEQVVFWKFTISAKYRSLYTSCIWTIGGINHLAL